MHARRGSRSRAGASGKRCDSAPNRSRVSERGRWRRSDELRLLLRTLGVFSTFALVRLPYLTTERLRFVEAETVVVFR